MNSSRSIADWWKRHFDPAPKSSHVDFVSRDGQSIVEIKGKPQGTRGLYEATLQLAIEINRSNRVRHAYLVLNARPLTLDRIMSEWRQVRSLFSPRISRCLAIIAVHNGGVWVHPDLPATQKIAAALSQIPELNLLTSAPGIQGESRKKSSEISKVLILRWLRKQGPIAIGELARHVGCSHPTVSSALRTLDQQGLLTRTARRAVELNQFPHRVWQTLVATASLSRESHRFVDTSADRPNTADLMKRLNRIAPEGVAWGGVVAARRIDPHFNLHGTPRLDLVVHTKSKTTNFEFVRKLDPALIASDSPLDSPVVVIHLLGRNVPDFSEPRQRELPIADPVETALDLHELGLVEQANDLFSHFRRDYR
jgi:DNA-binding transcriptional ArsR family regulator